MKSKAEIQILDENIKGAIIGRDGRNILIFQQEMEVEVQIDNTPNKIFLLGEDSTKLSRACRVMEQLVLSKKISPEEIKRLKEVWGK